VELEHVSLAELAVMALVTGCYHDIWAAMGSCYSAMGLVVDLTHSVDVRCSLEMWLEAV